MVFSQFLPILQSASVVTIKSPLAVPIAVCMAFFLYEFKTPCNRIVMGHFTTSNAYIKVGWTTVSDARDKNVQGPVPHGLDFVEQLQPKAFYFKESRENDANSGPLRYGFLAQDILALEGDSNVIIYKDTP